jgi:hypothetical protein
MEEALLHYIWKFQQFDNGNLCTSHGESVAVLFPGYHNHHAGPDFSEAKLVIDGMVWVGHVEIHVKSSDWFAHHHHLNPGYDAVVLHVVWENDKPASRSNGTLIPTLALAGLVHPNLPQHYKALMAAYGPILCRAHLQNLEKITQVGMVEKALTERIEQKASFLLEKLAKNQYDWENTAFQAMVSQFGFKTNQYGFAQLAQTLDPKIIARYSDQPVQLEALLFGLAGWLSGSTHDPYHGFLQRTYAHLSHKYDLLPRQMQQHQWKMLRLRPANFPTLRLAQLVAILKNQPGHFFQTFISGDLPAITELFRQKTADYWLEHYHFAKASPNKKSNRLGQKSIENLVINLVVPILAAYSLYKHDPAYLDKAMALLESIPPEKNSITELFTQSGFENVHAADSQGLLGLYHHYCQQKRCLSCKIGVGILRKNMGDEVKPKTIP